MSVKSGKIVASPKRISSQYLSLYTLGGRSFTDIPGRWHFLVSHPLGVFSSQSHRQRHYDNLNVKWWSVETLEHYI